MSRTNSVSSTNININPFLNPHITSKSLLFFLSIIFLSLLSCSPAKRFPDSEVKIEKEEKLEKEELSKTESNFSEVRVQLNGLIPSESLLIESPVYLYNQEIKIALIKSGNTINLLSE